MSLHYTENEYGRNGTRKVVMVYAHKAGATRAFFSHAILHDGDKAYPIYDPTEADLDGFLYPHS